MLFLPWILNVESLAGRLQQHPKVPCVSMHRCLVAPTVPLTAPESVQIMIHNSTVAEVHWEPVPFSLVRGKLLGYKVCCVSVSVAVRWDIEL